MENLNQKKLPLNQLIYGVLGYLKNKHQVETIPRNIIYNALYKLSSDYPDYFSEIYFVNRGHIQHSKEIEDVLFHLGATGLIGVFNPRYQYISLNYSAEKLEDRLKSSYGEEAIDFIHNIGEEIFKYMKLNLN